MVYHPAVRYEVRLRPATLVDVRKLAHLWVTVFPDKFGPILGQQGEAVLGDWFRLSQRHVQTTTLAEIDRTAVGFMTLETSTSARPDEGRWLWYALQLHNGLLGSLRGLVLMWLAGQSRQCREDEVYIEMLGVDPAWQGQGIAPCLLRHAETAAHSRRARQLCLRVMIDNGPAIRLYDKMGFRIKGEQHSRLLKWITGHAGYYEMIKGIDGDQASK